MPRGPVKTKPLQICFMRVSMVSKRPQLLHTSYSILALKCDTVCCSALSVKMYDYCKAQMSGMQENNLEL